MSGIALARLLVVDDEAAQMRALCDTLRQPGFWIREDRRPPMRELRRHFQLGHDRAVRALVLLELTK